MKPKLFLIIICTAWIANAAAQPAEEYSADNIKTIEFRKTGAEMGLPICTLGESLTLSFDVINDNYHRLAYSIQHCNANFEPDELDFYEFADGFNNREINNYRNSFNTHSTFTHYIIDISNDDVQLKISGNYIINIFIFNINIFYIYSLR